MHGLHIRLVINHSPAVCYFSFLIYVLTIAMRETEGGDTTNLNSCAGMENTVANWTLILLIGEGLQSRHHLNGIQRWSGHTGRGRVHIFASAIIQPKGH